MFQFTPPPQLRLLQSIQQHLTSALKQWWIVVGGVELIYCPRCFFFGGVRRMGDYIIVGFYITVFWVGSGGAGG